MYCMYCGKEVADNSRYCKYCGKLIAEDEIKTVNETEVNENTIPEYDIKEKDVTENNAEDNLNDISFDYENEYNAENEDNEEIIDDFLFEHISRGKRLALFFASVFMIVIIAIIVFVICFPDLI